MKEFHHSYKQSFIRNSRISAGARFLYLLIYSYRDKEGRSFPSREKLLKDSGFSKHSYYKYLNELKSGGFIISRSRRTGDGTLGTAVYVFPGSGNSAEGSGADKELHPAESKVVKASLPVADHVPESTSCAAVHKTNTSENLKSITLSEFLILPEKEMKQNLLSIIEGLIPAGSGKAETIIILNKYFGELSPQTFFQLLGNLKRESRRFTLQELHRYLNGSLSRINAPKTGGDFWNSPNAPVFC